MYIFKTNRMHEHEFEWVLLEAIHLVDDEMDFILAAPIFVLMNKLWCSQRVILNSP